MTKKRHRQRHPAPSKKLPSLMREIFAATVTGALLTVSMMGCSIQSVSSSAPEAVGTSAYPIVTDGSVTLRFWIELSPQAAQYISGYSENTALRQMEKDTGVKIAYIHPASGQVQEQFNLLMASGDLPDILGSPSLYKGGEFQAMNDDVLLDLSDKIGEWAPEYAALMQEDPEFYREVTDTEGKIPAFFCYKPKGDPANQRMMLREDVLKDLGAEIPHTIGDYEALFEKMLAAGITPYMLNKTGYEIQFASPYGAAATSRTFYKGLDGQLYFGQIRPEFKEYLSLMNSWFQKGYISKDFTSVDDKQTDTLFDTRKLGVYASACVATFNRGKQAGFTVTTAPYPRLENGQQLHHESQDIWPVQPQPSTRAGITTACKNVEAAVRFLNYGYTDEGIELLNWGVEGLNWEMKEGKRVYNDLMLHNEKMGTEAASYIYKMHFFPKYMQLATECHANLLQSPESLAIRFKWADDPHVDSAYILPPYQMTSEETARVSSLMTDIDTYCDEMVLKFITGAESLDNFEKFTETVKSNYTTGETIDRPFDQRGRFEEVYSFTSFYSSLPHVSQTALPVINGRLISLGSALFYVESLCIFCVKSVPLSSFFMPCFPGQRDSKNRSNPHKLRI